MMELTVLLRHGQVPSLPPLQTLPSSSNESPSNSALNLLFAKPTTVAVSQSTPPPPVPSRIECVEFYDDVLIIGTSDGQILSFKIEYDAKSGNLRCVESLKKMISTGRKPIESLIAIIAESKLLVLSEASLMFHSLRSLSPISSSVSQNFKALTAACADRILEPPFNFCVAKRRSLHLYYITENQLGITKEIPLPDGATLLKKIGRTILAADTETYKLISERSGAVTPLFPYDRTLMKPIICPIGKSEFLLAFTTAQMIGLGMFVNSNGDAVRGTLQWSAVPKSIVFQFPYIIALLKNNTLEVHNLFTQELISTMEIPSQYSDPRTLHETLFPMTLNPLVTEDDSAASVSTAAAASTTVLKVLIVCRDCVLGLKVKSIDGQISDLLESRQVTKAIQLAEYAVQWGETENTKKQVFDRIYERAGIAYFKELAFDESLKCFQKGEVDPSVLISLFGGVVSQDKNQGRIRTLVPWTDDVEQMSVLEAIRKKNPSVEDESQISELLKDALLKGKDTLLSYFLLARNKEYALHGFEDMDNFLLVVYEQSDRDALHTFLTDSNHLNVSKAEEFLWHQERFYALSLLLKSTSQVRKVLEIWLRFVSREYEDEEFQDPGRVVAEYLAEVNDQAIFLDYAQRLLAIDPVLGVQTFMTTKLDLEQSKILSILDQCGSLAVRSYLENLQAKGKIDAVCEVRLLQLYLEELPRLYSSDALLENRNLYTLLPFSSRPMFPEFLKTQSDSLSVIRVKIFNLLSATRPSTPTALLTLCARLLEFEGLYFEHGFVYSKRNELDKTLKIWVAELMDFKSAEKLCLDHHHEDGNSDEMYRLLLKLYLDGDNHPFHAHEYANQVINLLNAFPSKFELAEILDILPDQWSLAALSGFFSSQLRSSFHESQEQLLVKSLVKGESFKINADLVCCYNSFTPSIVTATCTCVVCKKAMTDADAGNFVLLPVGGKEGGEAQIGHVSCVRLS
ncbi:CNH domain-containing protein [Obelidium mucronatum]|nr:CNH domain-containing protein [Obelidium mucronatum]